MNPWVLDTPIQAICFDCDGTLTAIEGINELANASPAKDKVEALTQKAMSETGINPAIYQERLALINPEHQALLELSQTYFAKRAPHVAEIITLLQRLNKTIFLISAGLNPAVSLFGKMLNVPSENIFAVNLTFDQRGKYLSYDQDSPLIHNEGKRLIITKIKTQYSRLIHIGDGLNDVATLDLVTRFIGYGGFYYRDHIAAICDYYIRTPSLAALLPLCLTQEEISLLSPTEHSLYQQGAQAIMSGLVKIPSC